MNIQINLGLFVARFSIRKRSDTLFIKHDGIRYFVCPQLGRPNRVSVFRMDRFSETYLCPIGRDDTREAERKIPREVFLQVSAFMRARNRRLQCHSDNSIKLS